MGDADEASEGSRGARWCDLAERNLSAPDKTIKEEDLTSEKLESVATGVFEELGIMDQTPVQHEMPVETSLEKRGEKDARISTGGKSSVDPAIPRLFC